MRRSILVGVVLVVSCAVTVPLAGQETPPPDVCVKLQIWKYKDDEARTSYAKTLDAGTLTGCLERLHADLLWVEDFLKTKAAQESETAANKDPWQFRISGSRSQLKASDGSRKLVDVRAYLLEAYDAYKKIDKLDRGPCTYDGDSPSFNDCKGCTACKDNDCKRCEHCAEHKGAEDAKARLCEQKDRTRRQWKSIAPGVGIDNGISGVIVPSLGITRTQGENGAETKFEQKVQVRWATRPFIPDGFAPFRVAGRLGFDPVFNMTQPATEGTESPGLDCTPKDGKDTCTPEYGPAFVWDVGLDVPFGLGQNVEFSLIGRAGQALSLADFANPDKDTTDVRVFADFDTDSRWYFDVGARLVLFPDGITTSATRRLAGVRPAAELAFVTRWDRRLKGISGLGDQPDRRHILRLTLNRLPVFGLDGDKPVDLSFAVEHEWGARGGDVPSGTRIYLQSSIDLKRIF